jgi:ectoine hydroxylase-related dioxygenase (phytanoyl-CoA dioxygenase family)
MAELGASPIPERVEFLSDEWLAAAGALLTRRCAQFSDQLQGVDFSLSEGFENAPPHLGLPGNVAVWNARVKDGEVTVGRGWNDGADLKVRGDYQKILPIAQAVGPTSVARAGREAAHTWGRDFARVEGKRPEGRMGDILSELHDYLARRTLENPDLDHRIRAQGLERHVKEIEENGYTVIENAISDAFCAEIREACITEAMEHRAAVPRNGRVDTNGILARGRVFEEIVQTPRLRTIAEFSLGAGFILHTVGAAIMEPGPGAIGPHVDYVAVPEPFPDYALVGVSAWAFDDWTTPEHGPTWIMPGTHRMKRRPRASDSLDGAVPILMPKGSVTFFTQGVWHWQGERTAPGLRVSMHNAYSRAFVRPADDYRGIEPGILHRNSPVLSQLAGHDDYFGRTSYRGHDPVRMSFMNAQIAKAEQLHRQAAKAEA